MSVPETSERHYAKGVLLVLLATVGWSLSGLFVRHLPGLTGWQINCWRGLSTAIALTLFLMLLHGRSLPGKVREIPLQALIACASFFALGSTLYVTALTLASTATVSSVASVAPLFTAVLGWAIAGERPGAVVWFAAVTAVLGVGVIFHDGLGGGQWLGIAVSVLVALNFALQTVTIRAFRAVDMTPAVALGGVLVFVIAATVGGGLDVGWRERAILGAMGVVQLALPLALFVIGARHVPAVTLSLIALLDVVLNPLWSLIGAGEVPEPAAVIGGGVILAAVVLSIVAGRIRPVGAVPAAAGEGN